MIKSLGKVFGAFTGTPSPLSRDEARELICKAGGPVSSSINTKTDSFIAGESAGSKLDKAKELGIRILSEEEFRKLI